MALRFEPITGDNYRECIDLEVKPDQKDNFYFGSTKPNVVSLAEAFVFKGGCQVLAIYNDETMVGALFYSPANEEGDAWLTRFMIDHRHQGKGYGRQAMEMLIERLKKDDFKHLGLSYVPDNKVAEGLYLSLGFKPTGKIDHGQVVVKLEIK